MLGVRILFQERPQGTDHYVACPVCIEETHTYRAYPLFNGVKLLSRCVAVLTSLYCYDRMRFHLAGGNVISKVQQG